MNIDFKQLQKDKGVISQTLPSDDNDAWEAWDRISVILEELGTENSSFGLQQVNEALTAENEELDISNGALRILNSELYAENRSYRDSRNVGPWLDKKS